MNPHHMILNGQLKNSLEAMKHLSALLSFTVNPLMRLLLPHFKAKAAGNQMNEGSVKIVESHHDKQDDMMCWH